MTKQTSEIPIDEDDNNFFVISISDENYKKIIKNFENDTYFLSSHFDELKEKPNVIFVFVKTDRRNKLTMICKTTNMYKNKKKIKISQDENMNTYCCDIELYKIFFNPIIVTQNVSNYNSFRRKYLTKMNEYKLITEQNFIDELILVSNDILNSEKECEIEEYTMQKDKKELNYDSETQFTETNEDDDIDLNIESEYEEKHIPILICPCEELEWDIKNQEKTIENIKTHILKCGKCEKTDNNDISIFSIWEETFKECIDIDDIEIINKYLDCYFNIESVKQIDSIKIIKINNNKTKYNEQLLIVW